MRGKGEGSVYKTADGMWTAVLELPPRDGKRRQKRFRGKSKAAVLEKLHDAKQQLRATGDIPTDGTTVEQWFTYWLDRIVAREVRPRTAAGYRTVVRNHIVPSLGPRRRLDAVDGQAVRRVQDDILEKGLSSTYALLAFRVMALAFKEAMRESRLQRNPTELVRAPRKDFVQLEALTVEEALRVLHHAARDEQEGARWAMSLLTGARRGEVIGLERDRIGDELDLSWQLQRIQLDERGRVAAPKDFEYRQISSGGLFLTRPKSQAGWRTIPLVEPLRSILERHMEVNPPGTTGLVFTQANGEPRDPDWDTKRWNRFLSSTGIEKRVRLHDLRHATVDLLYMAGVPEDLIMEIVGHSTRTVTRGYKSMVNRERRVSAMLDLSALLSPRAGARSDTPGAVAS